MKRLPAPRYLADSKRRRDSLLVRTWQRERAEVGQQEYIG